MGQNRTQSSGDGGAPRRRWMNGVSVIVAFALVATVGFALSRRRAAPAAAPIAAPPGPVPAAVMAAFTSIPDSVWNQAGSAGAAKPIFVGKPDSAPAKPVVLYIGSLYCPYCAAARWSVIAALSRFGTFSGLSYSASSSSDVYPSTPTFSFHGGSYTSQYIDFQPVELQGAEAVAGRYPPLETPTAEQEAVLRKYDGPPYLDAGSAGGIPFMLVGGRYMWSGSPYDPGVLSGRVQADIASTLASSSSDAAHAILANANELTAAICAVDGQQPAPVCASPAVAAAIKGLPTKTP